MSGTGDLRAVLDAAMLVKVTNDLDPVMRRGTADDQLAALAAANEPLTATVEVRLPCDCNDEPPEAWHRGTVRIVAMTEDVLRARLRDVPWVRIVNDTGSINPMNADLADAIVRALFGEAGDE